MYENDVLLERLLQIIEALERRLRRWHYTLTFPILSTPYPPNSGDADNNRDRGIPLKQVMRKNSPKNFDQHLTVGSSMGYDNKRLRNRSDDRMTIVEVKV